MRMFGPRTLGCGLGLIVASAALAGCVPADGTDTASGAEPADAAAQSPVQVSDAEYLGIEAVPMDEDMISFRLTMKGAKDEAEVVAYGRCAAAQYALTRKAGFVRHVRTKVDKEGKTWRGDAVYLISTALPAGRKVIDAKVQVNDCGLQGIPTV